MISPMRAAVPISRRSVLGLCGAGALTLLAGCSDESRTEGRIDRTAGPSDPPVPTTPTGRAQPPVPDASALLGALERARLLSAQAAAVTGARGGSDRPLAMAVAAHAEQVRVLEDLLEAGGVQVPAAPVPTRSATSAPADDSSRTTGQGQEDRVRTRRREAQLADLAAEAAEDVTAPALSQLATVSPANLATLIAVAGQRGGLAMQLGQDPGWGPLVGPTGPAAATILEAFRPAVYAFEVLAARTAGGDRKRYERTLRPLGRLTRALTSLAGSAADPEPLGYGLPDDLTTPQARLALVEELLAVLLPTIMGGSSRLTGDENAVAGTVRLVAEVAHLGHPWGLQLRGFPGMSVPQAAS